MRVSTINHAEIDLSAVRLNFANIRKRAGNRIRVMAVVKADAYGHGAVRTSKALQDAGARIFGVAEVEEGVILREAGVTGEIVTLIGAPEETFDEVIHYGLSPVVFDLALVKVLSARALKRNARVGVHLKIDLGMGRLGILPDAVIPFISAVEAINGVFLAGILAHLPMADSPDKETTFHQLAQLEEIVSRIKASGLQTGIVHMANSAAMIRFPETHLDMIRAGISLYGCYPSINESDRALLSLKPAMSFKSLVIQVKDVPAGYGLSYGHMYVTSRPTRLAVLPVGYDDGYLRRLSNRAEVLIHGRRAPVCGRVCMNLCLADVTDLPEVMAGDEVVLMGRQTFQGHGAGQGPVSDEITADEVAGWLDTICYEVLCLFGNRNRRVYVE